MNKYCFEQDLLLPALLNPTLSKLKIKEPLKSAENIFYQLLIYSKIKEIDHFVCASYFLK